MKKLISVIGVLGAIALAAPISAEASMIYTVYCENGTYAVQTIDPSFYEESDTPEEDIREFYELLAEGVCEEHGSVPAH